MYNLAHVSNSLIANDTVVMSIFSRVQIHYINMCYGSVACKIGVTGESRIASSEQLSFR